MSENISVFVENKKVGELFYEKQNDIYGFNYTQNFKPISLIMPYKNSTYVWKNRLHPIFDMNMPEGYLYEIFKNFLTKKYGYIDDFLVFSHLCGNIQSRLTYKGEQKEFFALDKNEVLQNDTHDTFSKIVSLFMEKNAISGVQPKSLALLKNKERLNTKEYIIKTWGEEYPELALNEYFCLKAVERTGIKIPNIELSKNHRFLLVERFDRDFSTDTYLGFEEVLALLGKNKDEKYSGSYEQIADTIYNVTTDKLKSMKKLFGMIVMNFLLKNGDAHLKNFGVIYDEDFSNISLAPAYDVVNTLVYIHKDKPALSMFGQKIWFGKSELIDFGKLSCRLTKSEAQEIYQKCLQSLKIGIEEIKSHIKKDKNFEDIGSKMIDVWEVSLNEKTRKELPVEVMRRWKKTKRV